MKLFNYILWLGVAIFLGCLVGCGTISRGGSERLIFRGLDQNLSAVQGCKNVSFFGSCLGLEIFIYPATAISCPIDAVFDILLLPIDLINMPERKKANNLRYPSYKIPMMAINLTDEPISYRLLDYSDYQSVPADAKIHKGSFVSLPNPYHPDGAWKKQFTVELKDKEGRVQLTSFNMGRYQVDLDHLLLNVFLPCQQLKSSLVYVGYKGEKGDKTEQDIVNERLASWGWDKEYKKLKELELNSQCSLVLNEVSSKK